MTTTPLSSAPGYAGGLRTGLASMHTLVDGLLALAASPAEAGDCIGEVERLQRRLSALRLNLVASAAAGEVPAQQGQATTTGWLAAATGTTRQEASQDAALATSLGMSTAGTLQIPERPDRATLAVTRSALEEGELSSAHARVIAHALRQMPARLTAEERVRCERRLVAEARGLNPDQLRRVARRVLAEVEPDPDVVDAQEDAEITAEEDRAHAAARLTLRDNHDGTVSGAFTLPRLQGDILRKLVDAITAPRRNHGARSQGPRNHGARGSVDSAGPADPMSRTATDPAHARGLAFAQVLEHLPVDHLHGPATTQVAVTMDLDTLLGRLRAAGLDTDHPISGGEARRLVCSSATMPAVLGRLLSGKPRVLDLGRMSRLFSDAQRQAVHLLHTHCAARGCDRPVAWCELHHRTAWARGGTTDLEDAVPLCGWHHRAVHHRDFASTWHPDGTLTLRRRV